MRTRLPEFRILAGFFLALGFFLPVLAAIQHQLWPTGFSAAYTRMAPGQVILMALSVAGAWLCYRESRWIFVVSPLFVLMWVWSSFGPLSTAGFHPPHWTTLVALAALMAAHLLLLREQPRQVLLNPELRWWLTPRRVPIGTSTWIHPVTGGDISARTYDLSESGAFITSDSVVWTTPSGTTIPNFVRVGSRCSVRLYFRDDRVVDCHAEVVRKAEASGRYPSGFAIRFVEMTRRERRQLAGWIRETATDTGALAA